jgi:hypothetical protein
LSLLWTGRRRRPTAARVGIVLVLALVAGCGSGGGSPGGRAATAGGTAGGTTSTAAGTDAGGAGAGACVRNEQGTACLPIAAEAARVDRATPGFSAPTRITNPRFPVGELTQVLQLGHEAGKPLRIEVTRLPRARTIEWDGRRVETVASQFIAYLGGRIGEVAIDYFAQADDGSVWYFGEDVANYEHGTVADHDGTWLAGKDGPPGMIMPSDPQVGDVYRSENVPGLVFEQDTVRSTTATVDGPRGPVQGAAMVEELLMDGTVEHKAFAPGYGEFQARARDELATVALALPIDGAGSGPPAALAALADGARAAADAAAAGHWPAATARVGAMTAAWKQAAGSGVPELLARQMTGALDALATAVRGHDPAGVRRAAPAAEQASLDLQLRHRPPAEVDLDRLDLWARRVLADSAARDHGAVAGDVATLQTLWDRTADVAGPAAAGRVEAALKPLATAAAKQDTRAAAAAVPALREALARVAP